MQGPSENHECNVNCCAEPAVTTLEAKDLCLEHFFNCCYERLDRLEPRIRKRSLEEPEILEAAALLIECSNCALFLCLRYEPLSNLDRSRLLNILLLSGDLQYRVGKPLFREGVSRITLNA